MKTALIVAVAALTLAACKGETQYGECVGFGKPQDPALTYELSTRNAVWSAIFIESFVVPAVWALEYAYCPEGRAATTNETKGN